MRKEARETTKKGTSEKGERESFSLIRGRSCKATAPSLPLEEIMTAGEKMA